MKAEDRTDILQRVERFLVFMELAQPDQHHFGKLTKEQKVSLNVFKNAEPFAALGDDGEVLTGQDRLYNPGEQDPSKLTTACDVTLLMAGHDEETEMTLRRVRFLPPAETRGRIKPYTPYVVEELIAWIYPDGRYRSGHNLFGYVAGKWQDVKVYGTSFTSPETPIGESIGFYMQHALYRSMLWHVRIGYAGHAASLLIPCSADAILDLFRFRELPAGKERRDALLHWVASHWRRVPTAPAVSLRVQDYLRGKSLFLWKEGLHVQIIPSADDLARLVPTKKKRTLVKEREMALIPASSVEHVLMGGE